MLLDKDTYQTQIELAAALNVTQECILQLLKSIEMIRQFEKWLPREVNERNLQRRKIICEFLLQREKKAFCMKLSQETKMDSL